MNKAWWTRGLWVGMTLAGTAALPAACGSHAAVNGHSGTTSSTASTGSGGGGLTGLGGGLGSTSALLAITLSPATASIDCLNGAPGTQSFTAVGHFKDGTSQDVSNTVSWTAPGLQIGSIGGNGTYNANGSVGGAVTVTASYMGISATAALTVKLSLSANDAGAPANVQTALQGATTPDTTTVWAYPYDGTVWPRGLLPPILQWNGGAATDTYYLHVQSPTFEYQDFIAATNAPASRANFDPTTWQKLVDSTSGQTTVTVTRWDGANATLVTNQTWTIAPASMRGTIYYWSNDLGRVLRIQPGAAAPDDFANQAPLNDPAQYPASSCLMTCHTVSADGSTLISGGGSFGGSYDLKAGMPKYSLGGQWSGSETDGQVVRWMMPAVSPDGKYVLTNAMADGLGLAAGVPMSGFLDLYTSADGLSVPNSGAQNVPYGQPTWSPEGSRIAWVNVGDPSTWYPSWNNPPPGDLQVSPFDATQNPMIGATTTLVANGTDPNKTIAWPTITPDGQWVLYSRSAGADTRTGNGDLYIASAVTPNQEVRLASLDGDGYPFAAGSRDASWNFEPSFAPVATGGYFWVVFTSRRTYGNILTGDKTVVKQLWVAAIDQNPTPGKDPSHPAFHLTGQDEGNLAMRGFWALSPCQTDGSSCASGTECCGGYCSTEAADGGAGATCSSMSQGCSQNGDKCNTSADCCGASTGSTCINHVCSEATPK